MVYAHGGAQMSGADPVGNGALLDPTFVFFYFFIILFFIVYAHGGARKSGADLVGNGALLETTAFRPRNNCACMRRGKYSQKSVYCDLVE
jgi:hypothetical protein